MQKDCTDLVAAVARSGMDISTLEAAILADAISLEGDTVTVSNDYTLGVRAKNNESVEVTAIELIDRALDFVNRSLSNPECKQWLELSKSKVLLEQLQERAKIAIPPVEKLYAIRCSATRRCTVRVNAFSKAEASKKVEAMAKAGEVNFGETVYTTY